MLVYLNLDTKYGKFYYFPLHLYINCFSSGIICTPHLTFRGCAWWLLNRFQLDRPFFSPMCTFKMSQYRLSTSWQQYSKMDFSMIAQSRVSLISKKKCTHYVWIKLELTLKWSMVFFSLFLTPNKSAAAARHLTAFTAYPFMFPLFQILLLKKEMVINLKFENKLSQKKKQDIKLPGSWMKMLILQKLQTALSQQNVSM